MTARCDKHPGHRYYVGGSLDGNVAHLAHATTSDYPQTVGTLLRDGQRSWYEIDYEASDGTEAVYRFVGIGREFPQREVRHAE